MATWTESEEALELLEMIGGPFSTGRYRRALMASCAGHVDASFGAKLTDGTRAALALVRTDGRADSMPPAGYGGIVADRNLMQGEVKAFIAAARDAADVRMLAVRTLVMDDVVIAPPDATAFANASVILLDPSSEVGHKYARVARRSLRRAIAAGAVVDTGTIDAFLPLYKEASRDWTMHYPSALLRELEALNCARIHVVRREDEPVSTLLTLTGGGHWMCWLAAQSPQGREIASSYLAYDAVLREAHADGVRRVNLGASAPGSGGTLFKSHLGAVQIPMISWKLGREETLRSTLKRMRRRAAGFTDASARSRR